ncbi:YhgE/Pip domain-containing protein [Lysinibacillus sp. FSL W8-0992]|uniref:YhgE/Pip domain-containing protein n=1 Tax=Lysinibacillus sp. FSL W8-0992 TaxID=2954643 RepID=UPI0030FA1ECE
MFKNKLVWFAPILALVVIFVFSLTLFPSVQAKPKNLPIAIVNEDQGVDIPNQPHVNLGESIIEMIQNSVEAGKDEEPAVKWVIVKSNEDVQKGLDEQKYYAALVFPKDFSAKQASLQTAEPTLPEVHIYINQGMNMAASTIAGQVVNGVVDNINNNVRTQLFAGFSSHGGTLTVEQASNLVTPISKTITNVNETGDHSANGNAPISLFQPLWMAIMVSAAIVYLAISKIAITTRKEKLSVMIGQIIIGAMVAFVVGFGLTWIVDGMVGIEIPSYMDTTLFLTITSFSFFLLITAVISWLGIRGIAIFALMLFFGGPLLALAPEMMSSFYQNWIYPWLPMRFMVEGLRELFFFDKGFSWNNAVSALVWIGAVSLIAIFASVLKTKAVRLEQGVQD